MRPEVARVIAIAEIITEDAAKQLHLPDDGVGLSLTT